MNILFPYLVGLYFGFCFGCSIERKPVDLFIQSDRTGILQDQRGWLVDTEK